MAKTIRRGVKGVVGGLTQGIKGALQIAGGILTLDGDMIANGLGNFVNGALNMATFGGWDLLVDWIDSLIPDAPEQTFTDRKTMARGADTPRNIIYGRSRVGGQLILFESTGSDSQFMHMIVVVAPHEVEAIGDIYFNDDLAFSSDGSVAPAFDGKATLTKVLGDQTGAISSIVSAVPSWTNQHKALGCAFIYVRLSYDKDLYSRGMPNISTVVEGRKLYDPRTTLADYSRNHALATLDYLQSDLGFRATDDEIDMPSFIAGADACDQQVAAAVGTEARYTVDGTISLAASPLDNLTSLARAGSATINYVQGKFYYVPGIYTAPALSFDESDLVGGIQLIAGAAKSQLTNIAKGTYIDARQNYEPVQFEPIAPSDYVARDGEELATEIPMPFASSPTIARRLAKIMVERERFGVSVSCTLKWRGLQLTVGDRINLSIARFGWAPKVFRVESVKVSLRGGVSVNLREDSPSVWAWSEGEAIDVTPPPALNLPTTTPIPAPLALSITQNVNTPSSANQDLVTLVVVATPPSDPRYAYTEISYRDESLVQWVPISYGATNQASVVVRALGGTVEFRGRPVSQTGRVWDSEIIESFTVFDRLNEDADEFDLLLPPIYGLRLINNQPNTLDIYKSGNAEFVWQAQTQTEFVQFGWDNLGADSGQVDPYFDDYRISVFRADGSLAFEDSTKNAQYTVTLEENRRFDVGREFTIEVTARGANGQIGRPERMTVNNPAPDAPVITVQSGVNSFRASFTPPDDLDFIGFDLYLIEGAGDPYTATPERVIGNEVTEEGLTAGATYTIGVRSVDRFGQGAGSAPVAIELRKIQAEEIGDITAPLTLDEEGGLVITNNDGYIAVHGVHSAPDESPNPLVFSANDGVSYSFWIDTSGKLFSNSFLFGNESSQQFIKFDNGLLSFGSRTQIGNVSALEVTVGSGGDYTDLESAITDLSRTVPAYKFGGISATIRCLSGYTDTDQHFVSGLNLSWIKIVSDDVINVDLTGNSDFWFKCENGQTPVFDCSIDFGENFPGIAFFATSGGTIKLLTGMAFESGFPGKFTTENQIKKSTPGSNFNGDDSICFFAEYGGQIIIPDGRDFNYLSALQSTTAQTKEESCFVLNFSNPFSAIFGGMIFAQGVFCGTMNTVINTSFKGFVQNTRCVAYNFLPKSGTSPSVVLARNMGEFMCDGLSVNSTELPPERGINSLSFSRGSWFGGISRASIQGFSSTQGSYINAVYSDSASSASSTAQGGIAISDDNRSVSGTPNTVSNNGIIFYNFYLSPR